MSRHPIRCTSPRPSSLVDFGRNRSVGSRLAGRAFLTPRRRSLNGPTSSIGCLFTSCTGFRSMGRLLMWIFRRFCPSPSLTSFLSCHVTCCWIARWRSLRECSSSIWMDLFCSCNLRLNFILNHSTLSLKLRCFTLLFIFLSARERGLKTFNLSFLAEVLIF